MPWRNRSDHNRSDHCVGFGGREVVVEGVLIWGGESKIVSRPFGVQVYEGEGTQREGESKRAFGRWRFRESLGMERNRSREGGWPQWDRHNICHCALLHLLLTWVCMISFFVFLNQHPYTATATCYLYQGKTRFRTCLRDHNCIA